MRPETEELVDEMSNEVFDEHVKFANERNR